MDSIYIGETPCDEKCAQVGEDGYYEKARAECKRFIEVIRKKLGAEPPGAMLKIKNNPHDFGTYLCVECYFDESNSEAEAYAMRCESDAPRTWDDTAPIAQEKV